MDRRGRPPTGEAQRPGQDTAAKGGRACGELDLALRDGGLGGLVKAESGRGGA